MRNFSDLPASIINRILEFTITNSEDGVVEDIHQILDYTVSNMRHWDGNTGETEAMLTLKCEIYLRHLAFKNEISKACLGLLVELRSSLSKYPPSCYLSSARNDQWVKHLEGRRFNEIEVASNRLKKGLSLAKGLVGAVSVLKVFWFRTDLDCSKALVRGVFPQGIKRCYYNNRLRTRESYLKWVAEGLLRRKYYNWVAQVAPYIEGGDNQLHYPLSEFDSDEDISLSQTVDFADFDRHARADFILDDYYYPRFYY
jgi:hypothetical protein